MAEKKASTKKSTAKTATKSSTKSAAGKATTAATNKSFFSSDIFVTVIVSALLALSVGYVAGSASEHSKHSSDSGAHEHADDKADSHSAHAHPMFDVAAETAPSISNFSVTMDKKSGWNVSFDTANFTFSPENASKDHVDGEGHAHLYVDGKKITRLYSSNYYLGELSEGQHTVTVTLNTNDHKDYAVGGEVISAATVITDLHHAEMPAAHSHDHSAGDDAHGSDSHGHSH